MSRYHWQYDEIVLNKPPIGIMPRYIWEEKRLDDLIQAIKRYAVDGFIIPSEIIEEYNDLLDIMRSR